MSTELVSRLDEWARKRQIWPKAFACPHYEGCNQSLEKKGLHLNSGYTCTMSYVGREYGETELVPDKPFGLVIVGIDPGATYEVQEPGSFIESQIEIEKVFYGTGTEEKFNPHYRGVIRTASAILGAAGKHCLDHCYQGWRCVGNKRPNGERCVLRSFAQPNLVKCAPAENYSRKSESTPAMFNKCPLHLLSEIEVLKPDLVVLHGVPAEWAFPKAMQEEGYKDSPLPDSPKHGDFSVIHEMIAPEGGWKCFVLYLMHPARNGLNRQWESVVKPALELLRSRGAIPAQ